MRTKKQVRRIGGGPDGARIHAIINGSLALLQKASKQTLTPDETEQLKSYIAFLGEATDESGNSIIAQAIEAVTAELKSKDVKTAEGAKEVLTKEIQDNLGKPSVGGKPLSAALLAAEEANRKRRQGAQPPGEPPREETRSGPGEYLTVKNVLGAIGVGALLLAGIYGQRVYTASNLRGQVIAVQDGTVCAGTDPSYRRQGTGFMGFTDANPTKTAAHLDCYDYRVRHEEEIQEAAKRYYDYAEAYNLAVPLRGLAIDVHGNRVPDYWNNPLVPAPRRLLGGKHRKQTRRRNRKSTFVY